MYFAFVGLVGGLLAFVLNAPAYAQASTPETNQVEQLRMGLPPTKIEETLDALVVAQRRDAVPVVLELLQHRRARIRAKAIDVLAALGAKHAESALLYSLDDPAAEVREAAARALGEVGSRRAIKALLAAHDRGVRSALLSVGKLARPDAIDDLLARVRDGAVEPVAPAFAVMLSDPKFPLRGKVSIIRGVASTGSASAKNFLLDWLERWKQDGHPKLRNALFEGLKRIDEKQETTQTTRVKAEPIAMGDKP